MSSKKILLHACCAPCAAPIVEWLINNEYTPTIFFFNPNIAPAQEYVRRRDELARLAQKLGLPFVEGDSNHELWLAAVAGLENEPERGERCARCFEYRLGVAARFAAENDFDVFTTTLAGSRWKNFGREE